MTHNCKSCNNTIPSIINDAICGIDFDFNASIVYWCKVDVEFAIGCPSWERAPPELKKQIKILEREVKTTNKQEMWEKEWDFYGQDDMPGHKN